MADNEKMNGQKKQDGDEMLNGEKKQNWEKKPNGENKQNGKKKQKIVFLTGAGMSVESGF